MRPLALWLPSLALLATAQDPTVTLSGGQIIGSQVAVPTATVAVNQFLGIPFAQSPPERFSPPSPPKPWSSPLVAKAWKPACIQQFNYPAATRNFTIALFNSHNPVESEDCLYLNVYAPASSPSGSGRAVMYWIYGGALQFGDAGQPAYNGSAFAAYEDVIVVTVNYRTNAFGFPGSPQLEPKAENLGFLDQRAGLDWVQNNIKAFGGDPNKVTIFGESAGARSVDALLTSFGPNDNPPFRAAILESGQSTYRSTPGPKDPYAAWNALAKALNCTTENALSCLRALPAIALKDVIEHQALSFQPIPDNYTLVSDPISRRLNGQIKKLPNLSGTNAQEGRVFQAGVTNITTFFATYFSAYPNLWPVLKQQYAAYNASSFILASAIYTDFQFQCPEALLANASAAAGIPTWRYLFNATTGIDPFPGAGVYHSSEIPWVYSTYNGSDTTSQQVTLSNYMRGAWANFAKDPDKGPGWIEVGSARTYGGPSDEDLALLGSVGDVKGGGATMIRQSAVDLRCAIFKPIFDAASTSS